MANSLLTGISGLRGHQKMLEVVGNNLANLNTTSFKASRVLFSDLMYELQRGASSTSTGLLGSVNAVQISTGSRVSQVAKDFQQGNLEASGKPLDLAVDGSGFFVTKAGNNTYFTRGGAFSLDQDGYLSDPASGNLVQRFGTKGEPDGINPSFQTPGDTRIYIPLGTSIAGKATQRISLSGNLSSQAIGPVAQRISKATAFLVGGVPATSTTKLTELDGYTGGYLPGDIIEINGQKKDGSLPDITELVINPVDPVLPGDPPVTTIGDLIATLNTAFPGSTVQPDGSWNMNATIGAEDGVIVDGQVNGLTFLDDGTFAQASGIGVGDSNIEVQFVGQSSSQTMDLDFGEPGTISGLGQLGTASAIEVSQDGFSPGGLSAVHIDADGSVFGLASNGLQIGMGQLAVASFRNNDGLISTGGNYFQASLASGDPEIGTALTGSRGALRSGQLEGSNVDLALEFTRLIIAQRGFSANARTITVTDRVLEELTNIIR